MDAISICNGALAKLGIFGGIASLTEASKEARACNLFYANTRDQLLSMFPWPFATKRVTLAEIANATIPDEWTYAYAYPADCLVARYISTGSRTPRFDQRIPFAVETLEDGTRVIYSDLNPASLVYTYRVTEATKFPVPFAKALEFLLAMELSMPLTVKREFLTQNAQLFELAYSRAAQAVREEGQEDPDPDPSAIAARS
jgi:hypothetical protein